MIKQYANLTVMLGSAWMVYGYCQNDTALPVTAGCIIILSFLLRLRTPISQFAVFGHMPLSAVIIISVILGWMWRSVFPPPESALSPIPAMIESVQSGSIFASLLIYLKPFTKRNLYYLTFLAWLNVAVSVNIVFTGFMLPLFCFFCILSTAVIILHTTKKPRQNKYMFRYYRDFFLFSALLVMTTTGLFYGISQSVVIFDHVFMNFVSDYIMPRHYTHFLNINSRLNLGPPGRSAWDRRPVLEVTIPHGSGAYLKTQIFDEYRDGTWKEPETVRHRDLPDVLPKDLPTGEMIMFTSFENIIPSPSSIVAARGNSPYTKSQNDVLHAENEQRTRILTFSLTDQKPSETLTQDELNRYTRLPPAIARELKGISDNIVGEKTNATVKAGLIQSFFHENFKYSLHTDFRANNEGILRMVRERRPAYCSYFASAMALLSRAQGIPSRVAAGFLVTENIDKHRNKFLGRVYNAHAWTEVLLERTDRTTGRRSYVWETFDATPLVGLNEALKIDWLDFGRLTEGIWLGLLRFHAYAENINKDKLKVNLVKLLILIMLLINRKRIFTAFCHVTRRLTRKMPLSAKRPDRLRSVYRRYEHYLKEAFNETREPTDTDGEVIARLRKRHDIPGETIAKVKSFLYHYHASRFGKRDSSNLEEIIVSMENN